MAVVANVNAHPRIPCLKDGIAQIARGEIKLLPETGMAVRDVMLAILPEITAIGVDHGGSIEVNAGHLFFVDRNYDRHAMLEASFCIMRTVGPSGTRSVNSYQR